MNKRKRVFIVSLIILLLLIAGGFFYLFFTGQLGTLADLVTGPNEKVIASKKAQEIYDGAISKINLQVTDDDKLTLQNEKDNGLLIDTIDIGDFEFVRRFLWEADVPEGSDLKISIKTSPDGTNWDEEWTQLSQDDWYFININKPISKIMYMAEFNRNELTYGADSETVDSSANIYLDQTNRDTETTENEDGSIRKNLYAHLYVSGADYGRYLGSMIDSAGEKSDVFRMILLTDKMAFVTPMVKDKDYNNELTDFFVGGDVKVYFVDEGETNLNKRIKGEAQLATKEGSGDASLAVINPDAWQNQGDYLTNIVDISGKHNDIFQQVQVTQNQATIEAKRDKKNPDLKYLKSGVDKPNKWQKFTTFNTEAYKNKDVVKELQTTSRMKFVTDSQYIDVVADDSLAKLKVNGENKGYYIGSGVNTSGKYSDIFYPLWISNTDAWMGAGEYQRLMFYIPCKGGGDYSGIASFALGQFGVFDQVDNYISDQYNNYFGSGSGGGGQNTVGSGDATIGGGGPDPYRFNGLDSDGLPQEIIDEAINTPGAGQNINPGSGDRINIPNPLPVNGGTIRDLYDIYRIVGAANPLIGLGSVIAGRLIVDVADDFLEAIFGDGPEVCGQLTPAQASAAYNRLASVYSLRGVPPSAGDSAELQESYEAFSQQQLQQLAIYVTVDETPNDEENPPGGGGGSIDSEGAPSLVEVGASSGYSSTEPTQPTDTPDDQAGSANDIPGWWKGGLIKTGTDLIVLIVVSILVVIGLVYLASLLREKEDLNEVVDTSIRKISRKE